MLNTTLSLITAFPMLQFIEAFGIHFALSASVLAITGVVSFIIAAIVAWWTVYQLIALLWVFLRASGLLPRKGVGDGSGQSDF